MEKEVMKKRREALGFTQTELAAALGVKENTVYRWESGRLPISKTVELALERIEIGQQDSQKQQTG
jgi:transcriptional regulator with XRE-family HTH domain